MEFFKFLWKWIKRIIFFAAMGLINYFTIADLATSGVSVWRIAACVVVLILSVLNCKWYFYAHYGEAAYAMFGVIVEALILYFGFNYLSPDSYVGGKGLCLSVLCLFVILGGAIIKGFLKGLSKDCDKE